MNKKSVGSASAWATPTFTLAGNHNQLVCNQVSATISSQTITVPSGTYTASALVAQLNTSINSFPFSPSVNPKSVRASYNPSTLKLTLRIDTAEGSMGAGRSFTIAYGNLLEQLGFSSQLVFTDASPSFTGKALAVSIANGALDMSYGPITNVSTLEVVDGITINGITVNPTGGGTATPLTTSFATNDASTASASTLTYTLKNTMDTLASSSSTFGTTTTSSTITIGAVGKTVDLQGGVTFGGSAIATSFATNSSTVPASSSLTYSLKQTNDTQQTTIDAQTASIASLSSAVVGLAGASLIGDVIGLGSALLKSGGTMSGQLTLAGYNAVTRPTPISGDGRGLTNVTETNANFGTNTSASQINVGTVGKALDLKGTVTVNGGAISSDASTLTNFGTTTGASAVVTLGSAGKVTNVNGDVYVNGNEYKIAQENNEFGTDPLGPNVSFGDTYFVRPTYIRGSTISLDCNGGLHNLETTSGSQAYSGGTPAFSGDVGFVQTGVKARNVLYGYGTASWSGGSGSTVSLQVTTFGYDGTTPFPHIGDYVRGELNALIGEADDTLLRISFVYNDVANQFLLTVQRTVATAYTAGTNILIQFFGASSGSFPFLTIRGDKQRLEVNADCNFNGTRLKGQAINRTFEQETNFGTKSTTATSFGSSVTATTVSGSSITLSGATTMGGALNLNNNSLTGAQIQTSSFTTAPTANPTVTHTLNTGTGFPLTMIIALGTETGIPSASTTSAVASFRAPYAMKLYGVRAGYNGDNDAVAPASATTIQIRQNATPMTSTSAGTSVLGASNLVIDSGKWSSVTSTLVANNGVLVSSPVAIADDNIVSIWVTSAPASGATSLKLTLYYTY